MAIPGTPQALPAALLPSITSIETLPDVIKHPGSAYASQQHHSVGRGLLVLEQYNGVTASRAPTWTMTSWN